MNIKISPWAGRANMRSSTLQQRHILSFWRDVEVFNLPDFNDESFPLDAGAMLPWETDRPLKNPEYNVWRYTLLFGRIPKKSAIDRIESLLDVADIPLDWEEPATGYTCLAALLLDDKGCPDIKSYVAASFIFGIECLEKKRPISDVSEKVLTAQQDFETRYNIPPASAQTGEEKATRNQGPIVDKYKLQEEIKYLTKIVQSWNKEPINIYVIAKEVHKDSEPDAGFLNSFFLDDLNLLCAKENQSFGNALSGYLSTNVDESRRKDILADRQFLFHSIDPSQMPAGRWPSNIIHGLYTAQAGAVNMVTTELSDTGGIRGINGPPGTGKTTLLLDVIADIVVDRAKRFSGLKADKLFSNTYNKIEKENGYSGYYSIAEKVLLDSGIVVASNNNNAVENITKELPSVAKLDPEEFKDADYFSAYASRLITEESWGILSAALGNGQNKSFFKWNFWMGDEKKGIQGFRDLLWDIYKNEKEDQSQLFLEKFDDVKTELKELLEEFETFRNDAVLCHRGFGDYLDNKIKKKEQEERLHALSAHIKALLSDLNKVSRKLEHQNTHVHTVRVAMKAVNESKPSPFFFQKLFNTFRYKQWKEEHSNCLLMLRDAIMGQRNLSNAYNNLYDEIEDYKKEETSTHKKRVKTGAAIDQYEALKERLNEQYGITFPNIAGEDFSELSLDKIHLGNPYSSIKINRLRSNIFLKSLELHKYCILANAKKIRNNLNLFFEMLEGRAKVEPHLAATLWGTFFLCVPVVSTSLASVSRLFSSMGKESIGWLLLDEAGQATPQSAAGIIWRARRCVIVGDPLQVEPVVTIPSKLVQKLQQQENVDAIWSPTSTSVQVLADRISEKGTYVETDASDEKIWTGFALRTHRRCDDPMFTIANKIAYSNQMVKVPKDNIDKQKYIGASAWFHVENKSTPINKHVLQDELDVLKNKINALIKSGYNGPVFVISPFRSIANACQSMFAYNRQVSCGTIHKFQGKEAEVVFLVLGGNPASSGARNWASKKPNMLNVALTRAKNRFYVIGNRSLWGACPYFNIMAAALPHEKVENVQKITKDGQQEII